MRPIFKLKFLLLITLLFSLSACTSTCSKSSSDDEGTGAVKAPDISSNAKEVLDMTNTVNEPKILAAYFSCTGNTRSAAQQIAGALKADIHEIKPEEPYTSADLNWRDNSSRSSMENSDPSSRPAISENIKDIGQYDIIFLGYPIWWGQSPRIILTFLESYDFSGKTIIPFCTSGSSGVGTSDTNLHKHCSDNTKWISGSRLNSNSSHSAITAWIIGLELGITLEP